MRKFISVLVSLLLFNTAVAAEKLVKLVLSGPFASVSNPLIRMVDTGALNDIAADVEFRVWRNPDQMRAMALKGGVDFIATPSNVAANLYNRGADIKLLNISVWGLLWMVSREADLQTLADFKGREIALPFRGDMPDILFQTLIEAQGLNTQDFQLRYVATPIDAMQMLVMRRVDHALLAEPAVSMALRKTKSFPVSLVAPDLYRSVDLQAEWGRLFKRVARIPQAGIALLNTGLSDDIVQRFNAEYHKATQWCKDNPEAAGKLVAAHIDMLTPEAVADSIAVSQFEAVPAKTAQADLEYFYTLIHSKAPGLIGGKLPDDAFYYRAPE